MLNQRNRMLRERFTVFALLAFVLVAPVGAQEPDALTEEAAPLLAEPIDGLSYNGWAGPGNIKLDKTGGLTNALEIKYRAQALGLEIMIGCMVATSLSMAPALLLAQKEAQISQAQTSKMTQTVRFVDLDGPLLLESDRVPGLCYDGNTVSWPSSPFWGVP